MLFREAFGESVASGTQDAVNGPGKRVKARLILAALVLLNLAGAVEFHARAGVFECDASLAPQSQLDELVFARLERLNIQPANVCAFNKVVFCSSGNKNLGRRSELQLLRQVGTEKTRTTGDEDALTF